MNRYSIELSKKLSPLGRLGQDVDEVLQCGGEDGDPFLDPCRREFFVVVRYGRD